jgi:hypothetical protein
VPIIFFNSITYKSSVSSNPSFLSLDLSNKNLSLLRNSSVCLSNKLFVKRKTIAFTLYSQEKHFRTVIGSTRKARNKMKASNIFLPVIFKKKYGNKNFTKPIRRSRRKANKNYQLLSRPQDYMMISNSVVKSPFTIRSNLNRLTSHLSNVNSMYNTSRVQVSNLINYKNNLSTELKIGNTQYTNYFNNISLHSTNTSYCFLYLKSNILPNKHIMRGNLLNFKPKLTRELPFDPDIVPWVNDSLIRFIEHCSGKRALLQHNMNVNFAVNNSNKLTYRKWIQRMSSYERNLGHSFLWRRPFT